MPGLKSICMRNISFNKKCPRNYIYNFIWVHGVTRSRAFNYAPVTCESGWWKREEIAAESGDFAANVRLPFLSRERIRAFEPGWWRDRS